MDRAADQRVLAVVLRREQELGRGALAAVEQQVHQQLPVGGPLDPDLVGHRRAALEMGGAARPHIVDRAADAVVGGGRALVDELLRVGAIIAPGEPPRGGHRRTDQQFAQRRPPRPIRGKLGNAVRLRTA